MTQVIPPSQARMLGLPGRKSSEIVSGKSGSQSITLRKVEIPVPREGEEERGPHSHANCEESIYVLSGQGTTCADSGEYPIRAGDVILISAGEGHVTRNTGQEPLVLLCFFPVADVAASMREKNLRRPEAQP